MGRSRNDNILYKVQQELSLILTHAGEGIYGLDLDGKTTFVNNAAARMVGLELGHLKESAITHWCIISMKTVLNILKTNAQYTPRYKTGSLVMAMTNIL